MKREFKILAVYFCFIASVSMLTGCETLRKKFTRKRKGIVSQEPMIIVPRDYSANPLPSDVLYKQYFVYWKSWNQELITSLNDAATYKKIIDCVEQSAINIKKMSTYLKEDKSKELEVYVNKTQDLKGKIERAKNLPSSQMTLLKYDAERILSSVNRLFDLKKMKDYLK